MRKAPSLSQEENILSYHQRLGVDLEWTATNSLKWPLSPVGFPLLQVLVTVPRLTVPSPGPLSCHIPTVYHSLCKWGYTLLGLIGLQTFIFHLKTPTYMKKNLSKFVYFSPVNLLYVSLILRPR